MEGQEAIPVGEPQSRLDGEVCEWCGDDATVATEIKKKIARGTVPSGQFIYTCYRHEQQAKDVVRAKVEPQTRKT